MINLSKLPPIIRALSEFDLWIVGSAAEYVIVQQKHNYNSGWPAPRDYDCLIPWKHWDRVKMFIPKGSRSNSFGGFKFTDTDGTEIDLWPGDVGSHLVGSPTKSQYDSSRFAVQPWSGTVLAAIDFKEVT